MLIGVPKILSPELLATICEMGHGDVIVLADAQFPAKSSAKEGNCKFLRMDGVNITQLLEAILSLIPLDEHVEHPVTLMKKVELHKDLDIPVWLEYEKVITDHDERGKAAIGRLERFDFNDATKKAYCIVQTGECAIYGNIMLQKGFIPEEQRC